MLELSNALENERKVNENLHFALDNNHENSTKSKDLQNNMVKELQMSLTAVQVNIFIYLTNLHPFQSFF